MVTSGIPQADYAHIPIESLTINASNRLIKTLRSFYLMHSTCSRFEANANAHVLTITNAIANVVANAIAN